ncbi:SDR family oxidoreductase [Arsenicibacter rosenii]|uniref:Oxidoreductase n=1 Tax=Arsenicibacter rosenii TaxID=1750698 RepID=A0A1S2VLE0_9BACT|nr:SDR family NAD(P)-dependent oxidoreductase [Arsenicibacter rosenii]OIN59574.1 oxidoreductase [Arsenicibacter rosenii]
MKTTGNTVLITGGSSGIGLALAKRLSALHNKVIITGRDASKLAQAQELIPEVITFTGDLTSSEAMDELVHFIGQQHPDLTVLINNAAVQYNYHFTGEPDLLNKIDYETAANLTAPARLTGLLLPLLLKNKPAAVVNVSSGLFMAPKQSAAVYCATKAALHSFTQTLRYQLEHTGVSVFEIIPPLVDTAMTTGRGKAKLPPDQLADEFLRSFAADRFECYIGKAKLLKLLNRLSPALAGRIMRNGV